MIIRILDDGQYEVDEATLEQLRQLDAEIEQALEASDETRFDTALARIIDEVHTRGHRLDETTITPSDLTLPHANATLDELRALLSDDQASKE